MNKCQCVLSYTHLLLFLFCLFELLLEICFKFLVNQTRNGIEANVYTIFINKTNVSASTVTRRIKRSIISTIKMSTNTIEVGPIAIAITESIKENLQPVHLEVINESYMHNVPKGSETHFKVLVVRIRNFRL